jgi:hypothetical protein
LAARASFARTFKIRWQYSVAQSQGFRKSAKVLIDKAASSATKTKVRPFRTNEVFDML